MVGSPTDPFPAETGLINVWTGSRGATLMPHAHRFQQRNMSCPHWRARQHLPQSWQERRIGKINWIAYAISDANLHRRDKRFEIWNRFARVTRYPRRRAGEQGSVMFDYCSTGSNGYMSKRKQAGRGLNVETRACCHVVAVCGQCDPSCR